jgi:Cys-tRNA(Pro) deacylase
MDIFPLPSPCSSSIDLTAFRGYNDRTAIIAGESMTKERIPVTPAILDMKRNSMVFTLRPYRYKEHGGTKVSALELGVDEHLVIKTLIMEDDQGVPLIILMNGDRQVSTKTLARLLGVKTISPCDPRVAEKHTGYRVGGTSPFGTKKPLRVFMEEGIDALPQILINAGSRGLLAEMPPAELIRVLKPVIVKVSI